MHGIFLHCTKKWQHRVSAVKKQLIKKKNAQKKAACLRKRPWFSRNFLCDSNSDTFSEALFYTNLGKGQVQLAICDQREWLQN